MRSIRNIALALGAGALALACMDQPTTTEATPSFNIGNAPPFSGIIMRGEAPAGFTWADPVSGMRLTMGADLIDFCNGVAVFDLVSFQLAIQNDGRVVRTLQGTDMVTDVWPFTAFDCALFTTIDPLASGVGDIVNTDNDLAGTAPDDRNTNAWGFRAHGNLTRPDGSGAHMSAHINFVFGNNQGFKASNKITLR